ncbi:hypothetical protein [Streptomyces sp. AC495_CC817]|uniref:hypothetical protein n=1 Tax=Streptomyces sp. AC495_CC817 TaxID=2823900 RepID=UPI001C25D79D|nr:hypothetical protein [Streptomyces sp. AC495_CC817]
MDGVTPLRFDTTALTEPIDLAAAHTEAEGRVREIAGEHGRSSLVTRIVLRFLVLVVGFGLLASLFTLVVQMIFGGDGANVFTWVIGAIMVLPLAVSQIRTEIATRRDEEQRWYRLSRFAAANSLEYSPYLANPELPASLFRRGGARAIRDGLASRASGGVQVANYGYEKMSARTRMQHTACFVSFEAPAALPPMTLITRLGDVWGQPAVPAPDQREHAVDAEFDARVRVFCEPAHDAAVERVLTPEVREALLQLAASCDVEVIGGRVYVIARRELALTELAFWRWVEDLAALVDSVRRSAPAGDEIRAGWVRRATERAALFAAPPSGRAFLIGCLIPAVFGILAAALSAQLR